ncbi:MAG TPA: hypothetical protein ENK18_07810 [Deltaproteobacteria bacterium]|nr:hypothetical protein [Deltaproteobacteria bacterium]
MNHSCYAQQTSLQLQGHSPGTRTERSDERETLVARARPRPSSAVACAIPVTLRMLTGSPRALVRLLDVSGASLQIEHALPDDALAWLRLPFPDGAELVRARVVSQSRRGSGDPWKIELKFEVAHPETRAGLCALIAALRARSGRHSNR